MPPTEPRPVQVPPAFIESINALVRTSQWMLTETGRAPTPEELAEKLAIPVEKVRRWLEIARAQSNLRCRPARHSGGSSARVGP